MANFPHREPEIRALVQLLSCPVGYRVSFDALYLQRFENGTFGVGTTEASNEQVFSDVVAAVEAFVAMRDAGKWGYDWELRLLGE